MKKVMGILLAAVLLLCVSGCRGDDAKLYFPDNSSLKLTASEEEIVEAQDLVLYDDSSEVLSQNLYYRKDDALSKIEDYQVSSFYIFDKDGLFDVVIYTIQNIASEEEQQNALNDLKSHFDSIYGASEKYHESSEDISLDGYSWEISVDSNTSFDVLLYINSKADDTSKIEIQINKNDNK